MSNQTDNIECIPRPLTVEDAAGLEASVIPSLWAPTQILETNVDFGIALDDLDTDADIWRINVIPPSAMPDYVFYPICFRASLFNTTSAAAFATLFQQAAIVSISSIFNNLFDRPHNYYSFVGGAPYTGFDSTGEFDIQSFNPPFEGFPPRMPLAETDAPINDALGSLQVTCTTFDITVGSNTTMHVDARYLAFPRSVLKSAGFYVPRLWFKPA